MTSNLGSELFLNNQADKVNDLLKGSFKPEFLNRIDEVVYFRPLARDTQKLIVHKLLDELMSVVKKQGVNADYTEAVVDFVLNKAYAPDYGARPLKRFIQKSVETFIAEQLVRGDIITKNSLYNRYKE